MIACCFHKINGAVKMRARGKYDKPLMQYCRC